jgi:hypothetical protein
VALREAARFLRENPVFRLNDLAAYLPRGSGGNTARNRVKYYLSTGRLKRVARSTYAVVPPGVDPKRFQPDRYLVASAMRADAVFAYHSALELLGAAHSDWNVCTALTNGSRARMRLNGVEVRFLDHPQALRRSGEPHLGVRQVAREGRPLRVTVPERTLVDCFYQPQLAGGLEELVESAAGFGVLDLELLRQVLHAYHQKVLWAATGWFLERHAKRFFVPPEFLSALERERPRSPQYLPRNLRGGALVPRWNLVLPRGLVRGREPDEP